MSNVFTLTALQEAAQEDFGDLTIPVSEDREVVLLNPLRLSEVQREEIKSYFEKLSDSREEEGEPEGDEPKDDAEEAESEEAGPTMFQVITEILRRVAAKREDGDFLLDLIGDDKPLLLTVFNRWSEATQAGEA